MTWTPCKRAFTCSSSDRGCKAAKITAAALLAGLVSSAAIAVVVMRRRRQLPEPADAPPRVDDPLR